eukprot:6192296-Pleurochrysis_carterae.AAC.5
MINSCTFEPAVLPAVSVSLSLRVSSAKRLIASRTDSALTTSGARRRVVRRRERPCSGARDLASLPSEHMATAAQRLLPLFTTLLTAQGVHAGMRTAALLAATVGVHAGTAHSNFAGSSRHTERPTKPAVAWTIAGSDAGGGAGIQADLHAFGSLGVHGCSVITALTAQNSVEVRRVEFSSEEMLKATLGALRDDLPARAIKLGMLGSKEVIEVVVDFLKGYTGLVICDPVMVTTSGTKLLDDAATGLLMDSVFCECALITPNLLEAEALLRRPLRTPTAVEAAGAELLRTGCGAVLIKGGHTKAREASGAAVAQDYFCSADICCWLSSARVENENTHGTGCTLSACIAAFVAQGEPMLDAVVLAKAYVTRGIQLATRLGKGPGPVAHTGWPADAKAMPWITRTCDEGIVRTQFARCSDGAACGVVPIVDSVEGVQQVVSAGAKDVQLRVKNVPASTVLEMVSHAQEACAKSGARLWVNDHWEAAISCGTYGAHVGFEDLEAMGVKERRRLASSGMRLGVSTHSYAELATALAVRPSYVSLGPVFSTASKKLRFTPRGLANVERWRKCAGFHRPPPKLNSLLAMPECARTADHRNQPLAAVHMSRSQGKPMCVEAADYGGWLTRLIPSDTPLVAIGGITRERALAVTAAGADGIAIISAIDSWLMSVRFAVERLLGDPWLGRGRCLHAHRLSAQRTVHRIRSDADALVQHTASEGQLERISRLMDSRWS